MVDGEVLNGVEVVAWVTMRIDDGGYGLEREGRLVQSMSRYAKLQ